jgi:hypothetical protein
MLKPLPVNESSDELANGAKPAGSCGQPDGGGVMPPVTNETSPEIDRLPAASRDRARA